MRTIVFISVLCIAYQAFPWALVQRFERAFSEMPVESCHFENVDISYDEAVLCAAEPLVDIQISPFDEFSNIDFALESVLPQGFTVCEPECCLEQDVPHLDFMVPLSVNAHSFFDLSVALPQNLANADSEFSRFVYMGLMDESLNQRSPKWRPVLLDMLVNTPPNVDFDIVFTYLISSFPGGGDDDKIHSLFKWLKKFRPGDGKLLGDALRALTRRHISAGRYEEAVASANEMSLVRPDYTLRSHSLKAYAYAFSGEYVKAVAEISQGRRMNPPPAEKNRLDFLSAWILLQEGRVDEAVPLLRRISVGVSGEFSSRAKIILESLEEGY